MKQRAALSGLVLLVCLTPALASADYPCFFTFVKSSCWTDYDVTISVTDSKNGEQQFDVLVPKGKSWSRKEARCDVEQSFNYSATFSPVFWEKDKGRHFNSKRAWSMPQTMTKGKTAWDITVCYPDQFAEVPLPPTAGSNCRCDTESIPPVNLSEKSS